MTAAELPVGEWTVVYPHDDLGDEVLRKLEHDVGYATTRGTPIMPIPWGGCDLRANPDGSIDIRADIWQPGLHMVGDQIPITRTYRGLLRAPRKATA